MSADFLEQMAAGSRARVEQARRSRSLDALRASALSTAMPPTLQLHSDGFDVIAEIKLSSPALGTLASEDTPIGPRARAYARAGAAVVSVLTEPARFGGSLAHLVEASEALVGTDAITMRKDFLVDPYQIYEARLAGAGGVLLILRMLSDDALGSLLNAAEECGLFVLLEAFDAEDLARASELFGAAPSLATPLLLGLNSRDLRTLAVDVDRFARWRDRFPAGPPAVAESGLDSPDDVADVAELGYRMALIGSALMRRDAPQALLTDMLAAARGRLRALRVRRGEDT